MVETWRCVDAFVYHFLIVQILFDYKVLKGKDQISLKEKKILLHCLLLFSAYFGYLIKRSTLGFSDWNRVVNNNEGMAAVKS